MKDKAFALVYENEHGQDTEELFLTIQSAYDYMKEHNYIGDKELKIYRIEFELKEVPNFYDDDIQEEYLYECAEAQGGGYSRDHFRGYDAITDMTDFNKDAEKHMEEFRKYSKEINHGIN